jgi:PAS domain S-box-containing protein
MALPNRPSARSLSYWRERILQAILGVGLIVALIPFVPMTLVAARGDHWLPVILNGAVYGAALAVFVFRRLSYRLRAGCTLLLTFVLGTHIIVHFGLLTGGPACLFAFAVMAGLLLGRRTAVGALLVNAAALFLLGWLAAAGRLPPGSPFFQTPLAAVVAWGTFLLMNAVTAISAAVMVEGMHELAEQERAYKEALRREQEKLTREIDERSRAERALQERERAYRLLAENATDIIWTMDLEGLQFTYVSPSVTRMRGFTPEEMAGRKVEQFLHPDSLQAVSRILAEELAREGQEGVDPKRSRTLEAQLRTRDGGYIWVEATVTFLRDDDERPVGVLGVSRDIQERKRAEGEKKRLQERLQESQKLEAVAGLAGGIAHQFNNALSVILGHIELLERDPLRRTDQDLEPIRESAQRLVSLTNQLLAYARGGRYRSRLIPLAPFLDQTLELLWHLVPPVVEVETDVEPDTSSVEADETQLQMVLSSVVFNAIEAIEDAGRIRISCRTRHLRPDDSTLPPDQEPGSYVQMAVEDDGAGMDEPVRSRIFEPFFSTKFQGRGLGMAAAYGVVRNHGGWIAVDSEPGRGTAVRIFLPAAEAAENAPVRETAAPAGQTGRVLLVEDDDLVMDIGRMMLENLGYEVLTARTGEEALDHGRNHDERIDLALMDVKLPDMDAATLYAELISRRPGLKVIACSGYYKDERVRAILRQGADGFLEKPFSHTDLAAKIDEVLKHTNGVRS